MIVIYALLRYNERGSRPLQFLVDCLQEQLRTSGHALNFKASSFGPIDPQASTITRKKFFPSDSRDILTQYKAMTLGDYDLFMDQNFVGLILRATQRVEEKHQKVTFDPSSLNAQYSVLHFGQHQIQATLMPQELHLAQMNSFWSEMAAYIAQVQDMRDGYDELELPGSSLGITPLSKNPDSQRERNKQEILRQMRLMLKKSPQSSIWNAVSNAAFACESLGREIA